MSTRHGEDDKLLWGFQKIFIQVISESPFQFAGAIVVQLGNYAVENIETIDILALQDVTI